MIHLRQKLNRTNGLLAKLRHQVSSSLLKAIYFALFDSHLRYAAQVWGQGSNNVVDMIKRTQNKSPQIITFKHRTESSDPLYANHKILKLQNIITLNNCLFIYDQLCDNLPNAFSNYFKVLKNQHRHNTTSSNCFTLNVPRLNTETYGSNSIKIKAIKDPDKATKNIQFHPDLLLKRREYVTLVKASLQTLKNLSYFNHLC